MSNTNEKTGNADAFREYERWATTLTGDEKAALEAIRGDEDAILSRFATPMQFGTAGLRSTMDLGISRMNIYTVAQTTKGLSALILASGGKDRGVAISYDSRHRSEEFARTAARVLAYDGVRVYLFDGIRPTPELSFAILHLGCISGVNITASHNPKEYNGYKVYWEDGAQLPPEHAARVSAVSSEIDPLSVPLADFDEAVADGIIRFLGAETDDAFLTAVQGSALSPDLTQEWGNKLHLVYTPLHGTGYKLVPECLRRAGVTDLRIVEEQAIPDGSFPTVASPNPENNACFALAVEMVNREQLPCSLIIASDPDADRIGVSVRGDDGVFRALNGNRIGALLIDYILRIRKETGNLPADGCAIRSIVSSPLFDAICDSHGVSHISVLTGFKYIGEKIKQWEALPAGDADKHTFLFGYEESQGYLAGGYARDKDAIGASLLLTEMACYHLAAGRSIADVLRELDETYGYHRESGFSCAITGLDPMAIMGERMADLRRNGPAEIAGVPVLRVWDYLSGVVKDTSGGAETSTGLPSSDVLFFDLAGGDAVIVRPSGTEPKIKVYLLVKGDSEQDAAEKLKKYEAFMRDLMR